MPSSTTLPIMAGLSVLGAAFGITLGRSAIAEIDPAYFNDPEVPFHADLVPYRSPDWAQVQAAEYQQVASAEELGTGCIGCRDYPAEYVPQHDPAVDGYGSGSTVSAEPAQAAVYEEPASNPELEQVQRYASYPVSADEEPAPVDEEGEGEVLTSVATE